MDILTFTNPSKPAVTLTVTLLLALQIQAATQALSPAHLLPLTASKSFNSLKNALQRL